MPDDRIGRAGGGEPSVDGIELFNIAKLPITTSLKGQGDVLSVMGPIRPCAFTRAVCKHTVQTFEDLVWWRVIRWWIELHRWKVVCGIGRAPPHG